MVFVLVAFNQTLFEKDTTTRFTVLVWDLRTLPLQHGVSSSDLILSGVYADDLRRISLWEILL